MESFWREIIPPCTLSSKREKKQLRHDWSIDWNERNILSFSGEMANFTCLLVYHLHTAHPPPATWSSPPFQPLPYSLENNVYVFNGRGRLKMRVVLGSKLSPMVWHPNLTYMRLHELPLWRVLGGKPSLNCNRESYVPFPDTTVWNPASHSSI